MTKANIRDMIIETADHSNLNNFKAIDLPEEAMWNPPIVGFAAGDDDYFKFFKHDIGAFYWLPSEAFHLKYKDKSVKDKDLTVISFGFSQTKETKKAQNRAKEIPSLRWFASRGEWEAFIYDMCEKVISEFEKKGIPAVAIDLLPEWSRMTSTKHGIASKWSHRHTAFVAGLGTFGLSDGLITKQGKAMRFCTIIIEGNLPADIRPYKKYNEWCKFYADGTCGACMYRCPVHAITKEGHDKNTCSEYLQLLKNEKGPDLVTKSHYVSGCGLCQSKIPCQDGIPMTIDFTNKRD